MINSQLLLYLNLVLGVLLVLYFVLGRHKPKQPSKLNLRAKDTVDHTKERWLEPEQASAITFETEPREASRSLSVIFMYNGHDWEAHDVLGVPQGSSMHDVTMAYQKLLQTADPRSLAMYEQAYAAIAQRHRKHRL